MSMLCSKLKRWDKISVVVLRFAVKCGKQFNIGKGCQMASEHQPGRYFTANLTEAGLDGILLLS